jgi:hypothetical protein
MCTSVVAILYAHFYDNHDSTETRVLDCLDARCTQAMFVSVSPAVLAVKAEVLVDNRRDQ